MNSNIYRTIFNVLKDAVQEVELYISAYYQSKMGLKFGKPVRTQSVSIQLVALKLHNLP